MARITGLREGMLPQRDPWGEPVTNDDRLAGVGPTLHSHLPELHPL